MRRGLIVAAFAVSAAVAANAAAAQTTQTAPSARFTLDTPIEQLVANPRARAVLDANLPGLTVHPMYDSVKGMSLRQLQPMSGGQMTDEILARVGAALAAIR